MKHIFSSTVLTVCLCAAAGLTPWTAGWAEGAKAAAGSVAPRAIPAPQGPMGYTEAEIQAQLNQQHQQPLPKFRTVSGAPAGQDYRPGGTDVKIPALFFPPVVAKPVTASYRVNPDGTYGLRPEYAAQRKAWEEALAAQAAQAAQQAAEAAQAAKQAGAAGSAGSTSGASGAGSAAHNSAKAAAAGKPRAQAPTDRFQAITGWINVPAPSPFRAFTTADFHYVTNPDGGYNVPVPRTCATDPLAGLPQAGPMLVRNASDTTFMAATVDDPSDTYHYKNKDTFPILPNAKPIFTETRRTVEGQEAKITYTRYYVAGTQCLAVESSQQTGGKTYRLFQLFPEASLPTSLPQALYAVENLHTGDALLHPTPRPSGAIA